MSVLPEEERESVTLTVRLTYFKQSGKYYSGGTFKTQETSMLDIIEMVKEKVIEGKLPGLVEGAKEFIVLMEVPRHPHNFPTLLNVGLRLFR